MIEYGLTEELRRKIAEDLYNAEKNVSSIELLSSKYPEMTLSDAYSIQKFGLELRLRQGEEVVGRKIGITSRGMMEMLGVDTPDYGYLLKSGMIPEGSGFERRKMNIPIIEGEIAFIMGQDVSGSGITSADIMNATSWIVPCFEVCDARYSGWKVKVLDTISDDAGASKFVLGGRPKRINEVNLRTIGMVIEKNGKLIGTGAGAEVMGNPLNSMVWLANKLAEYGDSLKKGDIVLSGAFIAAEPAEAGDSFTLSVDGFPAVSVRFD